MESLENTKIYAGKHSREIQERAFDLGWSWTKGDKKVKNEVYPFIFFNDNKLIGCCDNLEQFNKDNFKEITIEDIRSIKRKFKPFDKVIVRDNDGDVWSCDLFSHYDFSGRLPYITLGNVGYKQCLPYEENKHLIKNK